MKFKVTDYNGKSYSIEKINDSRRSRACDEDEFNENVEAEAKVCDKDEVLELDKDEIKLLKKLLGKAEDLFALLKVEEKEHADDPKAEKELKGKKDDEQIEEKDLADLGDSDDDAIDDDQDIDEDESEEDEDKEEVVDCDDSCCDTDDVALCDSKKSFGSIQDSVKTADSEDDIQNEIVECWKKRYKK